MYIFAKKYVDNTLFYSVEMNFFAKIFKRNNIEPPQQLTEDEQFAMNFTKNGGKFIYCTSDLEVQEVFRNILKELGVYVKMSSNASPVINEMFEEHSPMFTSDIDTSNVYLIDCEYLITSLGGIMLSSHQLKHRKMDELPEVFIIFAKTSQMVKDIPEGMKGIKKKYIGHIPTGLITLQTFTDNPDILTISNYGTSSKRTYLILLEDLPIDKQ